MSSTRLSTPPGAPNKHYILPRSTGEIYTIPTSNSVMRLLVTGHETNDSFAVVTTAGKEDRPIGFHYHKEAHDIFLCLKGQMNVWANDKARTLEEGDFASVPPKTIHQYQILTSHSEFIGLIIPGGWEEFFRFIGEPYQPTPTSPFPTNDARNPYEILIPKLIEATSLFDMIPLPNHPFFPPQPWEGNENVLPGVCEEGGYFLKNGRGPNFRVEGLGVRPMAGRKEMDGKGSVYSFEGSGGVGKELCFELTNHAVFVEKGGVRLWIDGEKEAKVMGVGEIAFVPKGMKWKFELDDQGSTEGKSTKVYVFADGGGIGELLVEVGKVKTGEELSAESIKKLETELKFSGY